MIRINGSRLMLHVLGSIVLVALEDVTFIESDGNYLVVHTGHERFRTRATMKAAAERLDRARFTRIHRWYLVNREHVASVRRLPTGDYHVSLRSGRVLRMSRTCASAYLANDRAWLLNSSCGRPG